MLENRLRGIATAEEIAVLEESGLDVSRLSNADAVSVARGLLDEAKKGSSSEPDALTGDSAWATIGEPKKGKKAAKEGDESSEDDEDAEQLPS